MSVQKASLLTTADTLVHQGVSREVDVSLLDMMALHLSDLQKLTGGSGVRMNLWAQGSMDGLTWMDLSYDLRLATDPGDSDVSADAGKKHVWESAPEGSETQAVAIFRQMPWERFRLRWKERVVAGGPGTYQATVRLVGK